VTWFGRPVNREFDAPRLACMLADGGEGHPLLRQHARYGLLAVDADVQQLLAPCDLFCQRQARTLHHNDPSGIGQALTFQIHRCDSARDGV
jgi:hypothetical protein